MKNISIFILLTISIFYSCTVTKPVAKLTSYSDDLTWQQGRQVLRTACDSFTVFSVFERSEGDQLVFDIEIFNQSEQAVLVEPVRFFYVPYALSGEELKTSHVCGAIDPELKLVGIEQSINQAVADEANQKSWDVAMLATGVALTMAAVATGAEYSFYNSLDEGDIEEVISSDYGSSVSPDYDMNSHENNYQYWANEVLRKTTLFNGKSVRGKVYFPMHKTASKYIFYLPLGQSEVAIEYYQQTF